MKDRLKTKKQLIEELESLRLQTDKLKKEHSFHSSVISNATEGICVCHAIAEYPHVKFTVWNSRMTEITGYDMEEINRNGWYQSVYPDPEICARAVRRMERMRHGDNLCAEPWEITRKDGEKCIVSITSSIIESEKETVHILAIMDDITERKSSEIAVIESEAKYRALVETTNTGFVILDSKGNVMDANPEYVRLTGHDRLADILGKSVIEWTAEKDRGKNAVEIRKCFEAGFVRNLEISYAGKEGKLTPIEINATIVKTNNGSCILTLCRDITDRKKAEEALIESGRRYRRLYEGSLDGYAMVDMKGKIVESNSSFRKMLGYAEEELQLMSYEDITPRKWHGIEEKILSEQVFTRGFSDVYEKEYKRKDGKVFPVEVRTYLMQDKHGKSTGMWAFVRDVTDRKKTEKVLREREEKMQSIFRVAPTGIGVVRDRVLLDVNMRICEMTGYSKKELIGKSARVLYPAQEDYEYVGNEKYRQIAEKGTGVVETRWMKKDGTVFDVLLASTPLDLTDFSKGVTFTALDITKRKRAEEALRVSEEKYRLVVENAGDAIFIAQDGMIKFPNRELTAISGYSKEELTAAPFLNFLHHEDKDMVMDRYRRRMSGENVLAKYSCRIKSRTGETIWVDVSAVRITWEGSPATLTFLRDVTIRKKLEEQLLQAQKMEAVGQLAGGIAHDFNNILTALMGYGHLLKIKMHEGDPLRSYADHILALSDKAANLTQGLLAFSRKQVLNPKIIELNEVIRKTDKFLSRIIGEDVRIQIALAEKELIVMADPGQIEQVLMNLAANARDAMPEGGLLFIGTQAAVLDKEFIRQHGYGKEGKYALIMVSDTGTGIDNETRKKIFEPFFTTKGVGKGTGLGLSMVYGIIKQHEGYVDVYSDPGKGTMFSIYLPLDQGAIDNSADEAVQTVERGTETVLLAEDDVDVRLFIGSLLRQYGYSVIEAADGEEAVRKFSIDKESIRLVLVDVIMPKMNGMAVCEEIRKMRPDIMVIVMSGYPSDIMDKKGVPREGTGFILKPVSPFELLHAIREMLDKHSSEGK